MNLTSAKTLLKTLKTVFMKKKHKHLQMQNK